MAVPLEFYREENRQGTKRLSMADYAIECKKITKTFGSVVANDQIDLKVKKGEILALLGENGSGKTTLMNMLSGIYHPDSGEILVNGQTVAINSPVDAMHLGIGMIHQHFKLVESFRAMDNIVIGTKGKRLTDKELSQKIKEICDKFGLEIEPEKRVYEMSVSEKQTVEIVKVLYKGADILILDEPTAVLTPQETERLFEILRKMKEKGCAIIIITHKLQEVLEISDRVTILRKGKSIETVETAKSNKQTLTELMVGRKVSLEIDRPEPEHVDTILKVVDLSVDKPDGSKGLDDISFEIKKGEIHALMGENGAGKSTLIKVLTGVYSKDEGQIFIDGNDKAVSIHSPQEAQKLGISTVYQEITLCPNLSVAENMYIGRSNKIYQNWKKMNEDADKILQNLDIPAKASQQLASCSIAVQQMVAIARAVDMDCKVLILDEPTSSLDEQEVEKLFGLMRDLKARGVGIIFVTHFLDQVYEVCDKITVLRDGGLVGEYAIKDLPRVQLVSKMLGKELDDLSDIKGEQKADQKAESTEPLFETKDLCSDAGIKPFDFYIKKGEVNGFTGLLGSGRSECVRAIFGADRIIGGTVKKNGRQVKITKPLDAMRHGIGYLPEDRKRDGIVGDLSVRENIILALQVLRGFFHPISKAEANKFADEYIKLLDIKTASAETPIKSLSGGNQQKVILARWLLTHPEYLILDEPTRGIDVGTKVDIQKLVLKLAGEGMSVTFISSETDEMLRTCSRLIVMRDRRVVGELSGEDLTQTKIMSTIAGGESKHE